MDLDETFPAPSDPAHLEWTCAGHESVTDPGCDAVIAVQSSTASNVRSAMLLPFGTVLAFGMQVAYESARSGPP